MRCPFCSEETFAKKKILRDGWNITGEITVCALCGRELPAEKSPAAAENGADAKRQKLAALLGGDAGVEKVELAGSADVDFCRNCHHFVIHPFRSFCALTDKEADPMGGCGRFTLRD